MSIAAGAALGFAKCKLGDPPSLFFFMVGKLCALSVILHSLMGMRRLFAVTPSLIRKGSFNMFMRLSLLILLVTLSACGHVQHLYNEGLAATGATGLIADHRVARNSNWVLGQDTSFYVALSGLAEIQEAVLNHDNAVLEHDVFFVEDQVADLLASQISQQFPRVMRANDTETLFDARQSALDNRIDFVIYPRVYVWEDTVGTWSELANALRYRKGTQMGTAFGLDRARLQLTLLDATSGRILDVVTIDTRAGVINLYEENPQRLLATAVGRYVNSLVP